MFEADAEAVVAAPPERVWQVISDFSRHPKLAGSGEVTQVRMTSDLRSGATFDSDVTVSEVRSFVSRNIVDVVDRPHELSWRSYPPLLDGQTPDHQIEVRWSFRLEPAPEGATRVVHRFEAPAPTAGAAEWIALMQRIDRVATVRAGMHRTLANLDAAVRRT
jgi:uncharacterized protein YndB with AHSA1/START domain